MGIYMRFPEGRKKALTLSYDDGIRQDKRLIKILDKYGIKATFNINSGLLDGTAKYDTNDGRMSEEEIKELFKNSSHEIAVHGFTHEFDNVLHDNLMAYEILNDRKNLERISGRIVRGMAYPFGTYNDKLVKCLEACGIAYSRTVIQTNSFEMPNDWLRLQTTCHHSNEKLFELCDNFLTMNTRVAKMFYLWGHSYEFDWNEPNNNWERIEKFAEKMGGHDDIWYATNIEIYDYTKAYEALQISTEGTIIHNPTATDIWIDAGRSWGDAHKEYLVKAGETITLN